MPFTSGKGFVTVHDYVTTIHPWLICNRNDILDAMNCYEQMPNAGHMDLMVDLVRPDHLMIIEKSEWVRSLRGRREGWAGTHDLETSAI